MHYYCIYNGIVNTAWTYDCISNIWTSIRHLRYVNGGLVVKKESPDTDMMKRDYVQGR